MGTSWSVFAGITVLFLALLATGGGCLRLRKESRRLLREVRQLRHASLAIHAALDGRLAEHHETESTLRGDLARVRRELDATQRELSSLAHAVSHDLRAPLRSIDGFSQALVEDFGESLDGAARDYLNRVRANAQQLAALIDGLLMLSRLVRADFRPETVDLRSLAEEIFSEMRRAQPARRVRWEIEGDGLSFLASGDRALLAAALRQLLANAWKFTGPRADDARVSFRAELSPDGHKTVFSVSDNGVGFDMQYAGKLFGVFQRLHSPEEFPGIGVGLAAVQRIVHRHGGRLWAESAPDRGAIFFFTLAGSVLGQVPMRDVPLPHAIPANGSAAAAPPAVARP